jgi:hypothetical protein
MSSKKKEKFCISIRLACNTDGSERLKPIVIVRAKKLWCFKKQSPEQCGFYYWNNKKAWMIAALFEEYVYMILWLLMIPNALSRWVKKLDLQMKWQNWHICMFIDNVKVILKWYRIWRALASARMLCPFPEYSPVFQNAICIISEDLDGYSSISEGPDNYRMISKGKDKYCLPIRKWGLVSYTLSKGTSRYWTEV